MQSFIARIRSNWEFAVQAILVSVLLILFVCDHFGWVRLRDDWVATTGISLLFLMSIMLLRSATRGRNLDDTLQVLNDQVSVALSRDDLREVPGPMVNSELQNILATADEWTFRGGSGRWQREAVLPTLAKRRDSSPTYVMQVIDPLDDHLCATYGRYRAVSRPSEKAPTIENGPREVREDLLACIYEVGWYKARAKIRPQVILLKTYSPIRIDGSRDGFIITVADHSCPGIFVDKESWFYRATRDELEQVQEVAPRLELPTDGSFFPKKLSEVTGDMVKEMLAHVQVIRPGASPSMELSFSKNLSVDFNLVAQKVAADAEPGA